MPNYFKLYPSRFCSAILFLAYSLTILSVFLLPIVELAKAALTVLLVCAMIFHLRRDAWLLLSSSHVALRLEGSHIVLITRGGGEVPGLVLRDSVVTPALTILNVLPQGKKTARSVVIFPDSLDAERSRELRVLLRWSGSGES